MIRMLLVSCFVFFETQHISDEKCTISYYFLLMLLMNLQIKLRNSLVMHVSAI